MEANLIAHCGMNCSLCYAHQREKNHCQGCRSDSKLPNSCQRCLINNCSYSKEGNFNFCYKCDKFPCKRLIQLDNRYKLKYHMSMIENLNEIKDKGIEVFLKKEEEKWKCSNCGSLMCVHHKICDKCLAEYKFYDK